MATAKSITDAMQNTTAYAYDFNGRPISLTLPDNTSLTYGYNLLGQLANVTDASGVSVTNWFNNQGLLVASSNAAGRVQAILYDVNDRPTNSVDNNGITTVFSYDPLSRPVSKSWPADATSETFGYDAHGLIAYTNQLGKVTRYVYDAANRNTAITNANGGVLRFSYDSSGNRTNLIDTKGQNTFWSYDEYGRITNKVDHLGTNLFVYKYDANNRLTNRWTPAKAATSYAYDAVGNFTNIQYQVSTSISLAYDALNRVTNMVDAAGTTKYQYTSFGALLAEDGPWDNDTITYSYKLNHSLSNLSLTFPGGSPWQVACDYDPAGRLRTLTAPEGSFTYSYQGAGQLVQKLLLPNSAYITNTFDALSRTTGTSLKDGNNSTLDSHTYGYDPAGYRTNYVRTDGSYAISSNDPIGQLKTWRGYEANNTPRLNENYAYTYDAARNLSVRTNNGLAQTFAVNNLNELTAITRSGTLTVAGTTTSQATNVTVNSQTAAIYNDHTFAKDGFTITNGNNTFSAIAQDSYGRADTNTITVNLPATNTYAYDLNGNLLSDGWRGFDYDDANQLIRVTVTNSWKSEFVYDGRMRRRIRREYSWSSGSWLKTNEVRYIYDANLVIQERDTNNLPTVTYTRGNDLSGSRQGAGGIGGLLARSDNRLLAMGDPRAHAYYSADCSGNITCLINTAQKIVANYLYDPFGNIISMSGPLANANTWRFSSKETDANDGLVYFGLRYYDPGLQRWISRDPIQEAGGANLYAFAGNSANNRIDPFGQAWIRYVRIYDYSHDNGTPGSSHWGSVVVAWVVTVDIWVPDDVAGAPAREGGGAGGKAPAAKPPIKPCHIWDIYDSPAANEAADKKNADRREQDRQMLAALGKSAVAMGKSWLENPLAAIVPAGPLGEMGGEADVLLGAALRARDTAGTALSVAEAAVQARLLAIQQALNDYLPTVIKYGRDSAEVGQVDAAIQKMQDDLKPYDAALAAAKQNYQRADKAAKNCGGRN